MVAVPAWAISCAEIWAVRVVLLTNVVGRLPPFHRTIDVGRNPAPLTVRVKAGPPATAEEGDSPVMESSNASRNRGRAKGEGAQASCAAGDGGAERNRGGNGSGRGSAGLDHDLRPKVK